MNRKVVISDLHLGAGHLPDSKEWNPLEDFRFPAVFARFLQKIGQDGSTDLIIAGDFIDFWQILPELDVVRPANLGPTEEESLKKAAVVLAAHRETFHDLGKFAMTGNNRLIFIPGNHDVDLNWPKVRDLVKSAFEAGGDHVIFSSACFESAGVHIEHGNQWDLTNRFKNPAAPFIDGRLETNFGSVFMSRFYNDIEARREFIDNLSPELAAAAWQFESEPKRRYSYPQLARFFVTLIRDQKALNALGFFVRSLGEPEEPGPSRPKHLGSVVDIYKGAAPDLGVAFAAALEDSNERGDAESALHDVTDEEWAAVQAGLRVTPPKLGAAVGYDPYVTGAQQIVLSDSNISIVIMGHTHELDGTVVKLKPGAGTLQPWYVNTGCWQKNLSVAVARRRGYKFDKLELDDSKAFPLRFTYVVVNYAHNGQPLKPEHMSWTE